MAKTSPTEFFSQVKQEVSKVTWPTRKETVATTITVLIMVTIISLFFMGVDFLIYEIVQAILGI